MKIRSIKQDLLGAFKVTDKRKETVNNGSSIIQTNDATSNVAIHLHPGKIQIKLIEIEQINDGVKVFTFESLDKHFPYFQAGQYLSLSVQIGETITTRPYSICSAPYQTQGENPIVQITVREQVEDGFVSLYLNETAKIGDIFFAEIGLGDFCYDSIKDSKNVVALAGGSGITPFLSMAREIKNGSLDINLTILHGSRTTKDIILKKELEDCICSKVKVIDILSDEKDYPGEKGFINAELIKKYSQEDSTYFICGPQNMYKFVIGELSKLNVPSKRIHFEVFGNVKDPRNLDGYDINNYEKTFSMKVIRGERVDVIPASGRESIATSLERAGIKIHTGCRAGSCGFCRVKVLEGSYFVSPINDQRRATDKEFNYVYSCSTYPTSDITIKISI